MCLGGRAGVNWDADETREDPGGKRENLQQFGGSRVSHTNFLLVQYELIFLSLFANHQKNFIKLWDIYQQKNPTIINHCWLYAKIDDGIWDNIWYGDSHIPIINECLLDWNHSVIDSSCHVCFVIQFCFTCIHYWVHVFACVLQATDHAVGEEDPACKRNSFSCGVWGGPGAHPDDEGWDTPYGGNHSAHNKIIWRDNKL